MQRRRVFLFVLPVLVLAMWAALAAAADRQVEPISQEELAALMQGGDGDCKCLIVAMASWCGPCRKELPYLDRLHHEYKDEGLRLVGISLDFGGPEAMQPIVDEYGVDFPVYWAGEQPMRTYNLTAVPTLFVIKEGQVVKRIQGASSEEELERIVRQLLGK
jgi:thiol-disulfide isomerase/thioredoxin